MMIHTWLFYCGKADVLDLHLEMVGIQPISGELLGMVFIPTLVGEFLFGSW
jgi:hypothetical protein